MRLENRPANYGAPWRRDELILAFELYCRIPFSKTKSANPEVQSLATLLRRSPASVARKLGNFGAFDPELQAQNISGLVHGSRLDREIWEQFHQDWNGLVYEAHKLRQSLGDSTAEIDLLLPPTGPSERTRLAKQRIHQAFFRQAVLSSYESTCCVTGLTVPECLIASHIVPWSEDERYRTDPCNGLCLSATFDRLFDTGLIAISEDLTVCISERLQACADETVVQLICRYDGRDVLRPHRFMPSPQRLAWHRDNVFVSHRS